MESFLPSEIARLVYGYLEGECTAAAQAFLESSSHLQECLNVARKGRKFNTRILGRTLVGLLDLLSEVSSLVKEYVEEIGWGNLRSEKLSEISRLLQIDKGFKSKTSPNISSTSTDESGNDEKFVEDKSVSLLTVNENIEPTAEKRADTPEISVVENKTSCVSNGVLLDNSNIKQESIIMSDVFGRNINGDNHDNSANTTLSMAGMAQAQQAAPIICQPYNMVQMLQSQHTQYANMQYQQTISPNLSAVYIQPQAQSIHGNLFRQDSLQPIVSATSSITQSMNSNNAPIWTKPQNPMLLQPEGLQPTGSLQPVISSGIGVHQTSNTNRTVSAKPQSSPTPRRVTKVGGGGNGGSNKVAPRKRYRNYITPNLAPKLRPIAPKITQMLDNGIEFQVVHTKETPLIDTSDGEIAPSITKRSLRPRYRSEQSDDSALHLSNGSSDSPPSPSYPPPSPLFIDIQNIDVKR